MELLGKVKDLVSEIARSPESLLTCAADLDDKLKETTKILFDSSVSFRKFGPLPELILKDCDLEQIWQEIRLEQEPFKAFIDSELESLIEYESSDSLVDPAKGQEEEGDEDEDNSFDDLHEIHDESIVDEDDNSSVEEDEIGDPMEDGDDNVIVEEIKFDNRKSKDGKEFSLRKVHEMVLEQEKMDADGMDNFNDQETDFLYEDLDELDDAEEDEDSDKEEDNGEYNEVSVSGENAQFQDFFDQSGDELHEEYEGEEDEEDVEDDEELTTGNTVNLLAEDEIESDEKHDQKPLSSYERNKAKMSSIISKLEKENIGEKQWTLKGEVSSKARPVNSLLEEHVEFENVGKSAPLITEEVTETLEDLIKQRILDGAFNDVERRVDEVSELESKRTKSIDVSDEKNPDSLAQIYENELARKISGKTYSSEQKELIDAETSAIETELKSIFHQIDAMTHLMVAPTMPEFKVEIIKSEAASNMEDISLSQVSNANRLAPQELYSYDGKNDGGTRIVKGHSEKTEKEKRRLRSQVTKKIAAAKEATLTQEQREKSQAIKLLSKNSKVSFANPKLGGGNNNNNNTSSSTNYSNSADVFKALNQSKK